MTADSAAKAQANRREQIKLVLDMSNDGPMFKMLENMLSGAGSSMVSLCTILDHVLPKLDQKLTNEQKWKF